MRNDAFSLQLRKEPQDRGAACSLILARDSVAGLDMPSADRWRGFKSGDTCLQSHADEVSSTEPWMTIFDLRAPGRS